MVESVSTCWGFGLSSSCPRNRSVRQRLTAPALCLSLDSFDGLIPFDFKTPASTSSSKYLVNLLSMELTYFISGLLFAAIVKERVWDYSFTVALSHILLTSAVMVEFPLVWQWWLALGVGLLLMIGDGQLVAHFVCRNNPSSSSVNV
ncbi:putative transmembrane protein 244 isoform X1 [Mobula birostris]|uniref:putative transmembrane protein 244 isoform X3 n=1 Tax=Mobula birostris TaxID=1983395 RepID=UPI003B283A40